MTVYFTDRAELADVQDDGAGRLRFNARVSRGGNVQDYLGSEMGVKDKQTVRVFRPEEEVFNTDRMETFAHKYVTLDHPQGRAVYDRDAVGWIGDKVARDGEYITVPMVVAHSKAIDAVKAGKRELSVGYATDIVWEPGTSPSGEAYDAKMTNIIVDHVAIVDRGRAGPDCRLGDRWNPNAEKEVVVTDKLRTVVVDGISIQTTDQGVEAINKLNKSLEDSAKAQAEADVKHAKEIEAKDAEIAKKDAEIDSLKEKVLDDDAIDQRAADRADLIAVAKSIHADVKTAGVKDADIRKAVVVAKLGDAAIEGKPDAYVDARFDILAEDAKESGKLRSTLSTRTTPANTNDAAAAEDAAYQRYLDRYKTKTPAKEG